MNTWRTSPPPEGEVKLFALENMVMVGTVKNKLFSGVDLGDGSFVTCMAQRLEGWQPVPDTWKPEKTADEMFREMGYEKIPVHGDEGVFARYENETGTLRVTVGEDGDCYFTEWEEPTFASRDEVLACAQLIQEMEEENATESDA